MPKQTTITDYTVVVHVHDPWGLLAPYPDQLKSRAESIVADIKRHVDDVGYAEVVPEVVHQCEFCGYNWTEESDTYNGGCCDEDEENNPNPHEL